jgi:hypothetical protein
MHRVRQYQQSAPRAGSHCNEVPAGCGTDHFGATLTARTSKFVPGRIVPAACSLPSAFGIRGNRRVSPGTICWSPQSMRVIPVPAMLRSNVRNCRLSHGTAGAQMAALDAARAPDSRVVTAVAAAPFSRPGERWRRHRPLRPIVHPGGARSHFRSQPPPECRIRAQPPRNG